MKFSLNKKLKILVVSAVLAVAGLAAGCPTVESPCEKAYTSRTDIAECRAFCVGELRRDITKNIESLSEFKTGCRVGQQGYLHNAGELHLSELKAYCDNLEATRDKTESWKVGCFIGATAELWRKNPTLSPRESGERETGNAPVSIEETVEYLQDENYVSSRMTL